MQYYQFHIGDYITGTAHLSPLEDLAYRRLLDLYYQTEKPIPTDIPVVTRRLRLGSDVVEIVLKEFFELTDKGWENDRCNEDIEAYHAYKNRQKANGKKGGRPKKQPQNKPTKNPVVTSGKPTVNPNETQNNPNHKPTTINQQPSFKKLTKDEFKIEVWKSGQEKYDNSMLAEFFEYWIEPDDKGKMRFQLQKTWSVSGRLATWNRNNFGGKFQGNSSGPIQNASKLATTEEIASDPNVAGTIDELQF